MCSMPGAMNSDFNLAVWPAVCASDCRVSSGAGVSVPVLRNANKPAARRRVSRVWLPSDMILFVLKEISKQRRVAKKLAQPEIPKSEGYYSFSRSSTSSSPRRVRQSLLRLTFTTSISLMTCVFVFLLWQTSNYTVDIKGAHESDPGSNSIA